MPHLRLYHGTDANFIAHSFDSIKVIEEKHTDFEAFSTYFTAENLTELKQLHTNASNIASDNVFVDIQTQATDKVKQENELCAKLFQRSKFDIEVIFPNDKFIWNQFGFNDYTKASRSHKQMYMFLTDFHMAAIRHKDALLANGWTEERIADILTHRDRLQEAMAEQSQKKLERRQATGQRMNILNDLYTKLSHYYKAAQIIFEDDENLLEYFKFPTATSTNKEEENEENLSEENI
jgi:hypothetical protein